jgi:4-hydroxy-2-oxoglutarate aldolase
LVRHYAAVADASPIPIVLYNMPANTGVDLSAEAVEELSQHANIGGLKESSPDMVKIGRMVQRCRSGFSVLAGSAGFFLAALAMGASGGVMALANLAARQLHDLAGAFRAGDLDEARRLQASLLDLNRLVTAHHGVAGLKAALDMLGMYGGPVRGPLQPVEASAKEEIRLAMVAAGVVEALA